MSREEFDNRVESLFEHPDPAERARIEALVDADPALRARWDDVQPALDVLGAATLEPLPASLHATLTETAQGAGGATVPRVRARGTSGSWLDFVRAAIQVRPAFALGGAVAAGIAIGAVGLALLNGLPGEGPHAGQDLGRSTSASLPPMPEASTLTTLDLGEAHATLTVRRTARQQLVVHLEARATTPASVTLAWDPAVLRWSGASWQTSAAPAFESGTGHLRLLVTASGSELVFVESVSGSSRLRATLSAAGEEKEETVRVPR